MEVQLYVYDLSQGMARQFSRQFLGTHIDAVYHTAVVLEGIEYFFGQGIQSTRAGTTHHGRPMEVVSLGRTELPIELVLEYLDSLKSIYTAESYDLFMHNCNNFSNDFAMFLVGSKIPDHITSLPSTVLATPFGQMLRPYLDQSMRSITQAPVVNTAPPSTTSNKTTGAVHNITSLPELQATLDSARSSCAVIFFTSSTCAPCKVLYPTYDTLAQEAGSKATLIKVDINFAQEIAASFKVQATPTIMTFLKGQKEEEWAGADVSRLRSSVEYLIRQAHPSHPHEDIRAFELLDAAQRMVKYGKIPPMVKLLPKLDKLKQENAAVEMMKFLDKMNNSIKQENPLPSLPEFAAFIQKCLAELHIDSLFAAYDLFRAALIDPRVSAFFIEPQYISIISSMIDLVNSKGSETPYNLRIITLHLACNLLAGPLCSTLSTIPADLLSALISLVTSNLLDAENANIRVAAASLAFNLAAGNHKARVEKGNDALSTEMQIELIAAGAESLASESQSSEAATGLLMTLALLVRMTALDGEVVDLCRALDIAGTAKAKESFVQKNEATKQAVELLTKRL